MLYTHYTEIKLTPSANEKRTMERNISGKDYILSVIVELSDSS